MSEEEKSLSVSPMKRHFAMAHEYRDELLDIMRTYKKLGLNEFEITFWAINATFKMEEAKK